jgi:hypothetical protein
MKVCCYDWIWTEITSSARGTQRARGVLEPLCLTQREFFHPVTHLVAIQAQELGGFVWLLLARSRPSHQLLVVHHQNSGEGHAAEV